MKILDWFNRKGMNWILMMFGLSIVVALLKHWYVLPDPILNLGIDVEGILFISAGGLFVFAILIFAPLYRRLNREPEHKGISRVYGKNNVSKR